jgi:integrase/recombinase XerD
VKRQPRDDKPSTANKRISRSPESRRSPETEAVAIARADWSRILGDDLYRVASSLDVRDADDSSTVRAWTASWLVRTRSRDTRSVYRIGIAIYMRWCAERHINPARAGYTDCERYAHWLRHTTPDPATPGPNPDRYSDASRARMLSTMASWYEHGVRSRLIGRNPARTVDRPALDSAVSPNALSEQDREAMIMSALSWSGNRIRCLTLAAVLMLGFDHGWRRAQLVAARVEALTVKGGRPAIETRTTGGGTRTDVLSDRCRDTIGELMELRGNPESGPLLWFRFNRRMSGMHLTRLVGQLGARAGVAGPVTPHRLRLVPPLDPDAAVLEPTGTNAAAAGPDRQDDR